MAYSNFIIDYTLTDTAPVTEPVTLAEAKLYCRVSTSVDDNQISLMIKQAREAIEVGTGLSLIPKTAVVWFTNFNGTFNLPYGPVNSFTSLIDENGDTIVAADYTLVGGKFPMLTRPLWKNLKATYTVGYTTIPNDLKIAILDQVSYDYENRGLDSNTGICEKSWKACQRWTRISPIL
jgi:uncharacterized phiE125 gp8 family phage protein